MKKKDKKPDNTLSRNKKAFHDYHIIDTYEAGIELRGTEVKSCRDKNISLLDSFSASAAGLHALNESHLYTIEAIEQLLRRLLSCPNWPCLRW